MIRCWEEGDPQGHARVGMVWGPFAETKGPRRAGPKPRSNKNNLTKHSGCLLTNDSDHFSLFLEHNIPKVCDG